MRFNPKHLRISKTLIGIASISLCVVFLLFVLTQTTVRKNEKRYLQQSLVEVMPQDVQLSAFDNDVLASAKTIGDQTVYLACQNGKLDYLLIEMQTDEGYNGDIRLLANIDVRKQQVVAIKPLLHQETPGLGDQIDTDKSNWLQQFIQPLTTPKQQLALRQDGGAIDAIAAATITSRAVATVIIHRVFNFALDSQRCP